MKQLLNKRLLIWCGAGLVIVLVLVYFFTRPKTGMVTVTAPDAVEISSARINNVVLEEPTRIGAGDQSFSLPVGSYVISGESTESAYKTVVIVMEGQEKEVVFSDYSIKALEADDTLKAKYFTNAGDNYRYLDNEDGVIYTYFGSNIVPERYNYSARDIAEITWLNSSTAVAVANQQLYRLSENDFSFLTYPDSQQPELDVQPIVSGYSVADNGHIFAVVNGNLYRYDSISKPPVLVNETDSYATFPFASPNGAVVLATDTTLSGHRDEEAINIVVDKNGEEIVDNFSDRGIFFVSWSPDSKRFVYSDDVGLWLYSMDAKSSELLVKGSDFSSGTLLWTDESTVLHYDQGNLWQYDANSRVGYAKYSFSQPDLLSDFTSPGSMSRLNDELVLSIDTKSAVTPSKLYFINLREQ